MGVRGAVLAAMAAMCLGGCMSDGGANALTPDGPADRTPKGGAAQAFFDAETAARSDEKLHPGTPAAVASATQMFETGAALIYGNCNAYFDSAGHTQTWLVRSRDAVGVTSALGDSVMVLARANTRLLNAWALGTTAAYAGIDFVTKDFLFDADNIESVRDLTTKALATHKKAVESSGQTFTYEFVTGQLLDEQVICTDRSIAALAKDAIANGRLKASSNSLDDDLKRIDALQDQAMLEALGRDVHVTGPLTTAEAGALWWFVIERPVGDLEYAAIHDRLSHLAPTDNPVTATQTGVDAKGNAVFKYAPTDPWPDAVTVTRDLDRLSDDTKAAFKQQVADARKKANQRTEQARIAEKKGGPPAVTYVADPDFVLGAPASGVIPHFRIRAQ